MTKPNAELAYRVLDHIDAHPEQWNQGRWIGKSECQTVGCFAGWAVLLSGAEPIDFGSDWMDNGLTYTTGVEFEGESWTVSQLAQRLLRADRWLDEGYDDERDLFDGDNTREVLGHLVAEIFGLRPVGS
jgi:hypothetical protein